ncbi:PQQ-binding-like beta-propeller repeat protein [Streptomyces sp. HMX112]|uniref:outer membrane protein assembly factor BamB family protein n=1 Tax=Streptomyces sp. HMX112 TaxID=3390850 RepID=UPI003A8003A2
MLTLDGGIRAIDTATRDVRWTVPAPAGTVGEPGPQATAGGGRLVVSGTNGHVFALDTGTGRQVWQIPGQSLDPLLPVIDGGVVLLGGRTLTARALPDGRELASVEAQTRPEHSKGGWGPPTVYEDKVIALDGGLFRRFDKKLSRLDYWPASTEGARPALQPLVVQGNTLWAVEGGPHFGVSALSRSDDTLMWTYQPDNRGPWSMTGAGNRVFLVSRGELTAMPVF